MVGVCASPVVASISRSKDKANVPAGHWCARPLSLLPRHDKMVDRKLQPCSLDKAVARCLSSESRVFNGVDSKDERGVHRVSKVQLKNAVTSPSWRWRRRCSCSRCGQGRDPDCEKHRASMT